MIIVKKRIEAYRGESFTIGFVLSKEYNGFELPFYIQAGIENPYYLLQVRNTQFPEKSKGSVYNYWIEGKVMGVKDGIAKKNCNLIACHGNPIQCAYDQEPERQKVYGNRIPKQDDMLYGINEYQYPYIVIQNGPSLMAIDNEYPWTMFKKTFLPVDTRRFVEGTWWYELTLVSGTKMVDYLRSIYENKSPVDQMDIHEKREYDTYGRCRKWLYDSIKAKDESLVNGIKWYEPLVNYFAVDKTSGPEKFIVR